MTVAILIPVLRRPHRVSPLLDSIRSTAPSARVLFLTTTDDHAEKAAISAAGGEHLDVGAWGKGDYARKVNAGCRHTTEPLLFLGADDLLFHPGWFEAAAAKLDGRVGVVGTNDLGSPRVMAGEHSTHSLVTRDYVERFGTIDEVGKVLHEGYLHEFVDDELVATAKARGMWAFAADSHVEHLHPNWSKAPTDDLYRQQHRRMRAGRQLFNRRQCLWT